MDPLGAMDKSLSVYGSREQIECGWDAGPPSLPIEEQCRRAGQVGVWGAWGLSSVINSNSHNLRLSEDTSGICANSSQALCGSQQGAEALSGILPWVNQSSCRPCLPSSASGPGAWLLLGAGFHPSPSHGTEMSFLQFVGLE